MTTWRRLPWNLLLTEWLQSLQAANSSTVQGGGKGRAVNAASGARPATTDCKRHSRTAARAVTAITVADNNKVCRTGLAELADQRDDEPYVYRRQRDDRTAGAEMAKLG